jgi:hypothetical protein
VEKLESDQQIEITSKCTTISSYMSAMSLYLRTHYVVSTSFDEKLQKIYLLQGIDELEQQYPFLEISFCALKMRKVAVIAFDVSLSI